MISNRRKTGSEVEHAQRLRKRMQDHAPSYYPGVFSSTANVQLVFQSIRHNSQLFEFRIMQGTAERRVLVKVPFAPKHVEPGRNEDGTTDNDRPRLFPKTKPFLKGLYEYRALTRIQEHFSSDSQGRFGSIRLLELMENPYTIVMDKSSDPGLRNLLLSSHRLAPAARWDLVEQGCFRAGVWLQQFHGLSALNHTETRNAERDDYVCAVNAFLDFVNDEVPKRKYLKDVRQGLNAAANSELLDQIPLGMSHGDYAPRNILVNSEAKVTVFDTMGRWRAPIYEDIAHFLASLKGSILQLLCPSIAFDTHRIADAEAAFLQGYFGATIVPNKTIRLFECQLLIERWAAIAFRSKEASGLRAIAKRCRQSFFQPYVMRSIQTALKQINA